MKVYVTGPSNYPSGGTKVMNQIVQLFREKGLESFLVLADEGSSATFIDQPPPVMNISEYEKNLRNEDLTIDFWPAQRFFDITSKKINRYRVFWQHGASIPTGKDLVDSKVFEKGNPYTHHWNVSKACRDYISEKFQLSPIAIIHPFFDTESMKDSLVQKESSIRNGFLVIARRGSKYIPSIIKELCPRHKVTVLHGMFHEKELFEELIHHQFFISIDHGIHGPTLLNKLIVAAKKTINKELRIKEQQRNTWLLPPNHMLGFPMSAAEAAWLGAFVIGFAMGGGLEWMNEENCFLAKDANQESLLSSIKRALQATPSQLQAMAKNAETSVGKFTKEQTWNEIKQSLQWS